MTHPKKDIELVEILQASCADGDDVLRSLMVHTLQRVLEEEIKVFLKLRHMRGQISVKAIVMATSLEP